MAEEMEIRQIGKGAYGSVYYPAIFCKNATKNPSECRDRQKCVSKLLKPYGYEIKANQMIREFDPTGKFSATWFPVICDDEETIKELMMKMGIKHSRYRNEVLAYMPYIKGVSIREIIGRVSNNTMMMHLIKLFRVFVEHIHRLNQNHIYHKDLHMDNIIVTDDRMIAIDWDRAEMISSDGIGYFWFDGHQLVRIFGELIGMDIPKIYDLQRKISKYDDFYRLIDDEISANRQKGGRTKKAQKQKK